MTGRYRHRTDDHHLVHCATVITEPERTLKDLAQPAPDNTLSSPNPLNVRSGSVAGPPPVPRAAIAAAQPPSADDSRPAPPAGRAHHRQPKTALAPRHCPPIEALTDLVMITFGLTPRSGPCSAHEDRLARTDHERGVLAQQSTIGRSQVTRALRSGRDDDPPP
jgi:hypothetical protein